MPCPFHKMRRWFSEPEAKNWERIIEKNALTVAIKIKPVVLRVKFFPLEAGGHSLHFPGEQRKITECYMKVVGVFKLTSDLFILNTIAMNLDWPGAHILARLNSSLTPPCHHSIRKLIVVTQNTSFPKWTTNPKTRIRVFPFPACLTVILGAFIPWIKLQNWPAPRGKRPRSVSRQIGRFSVVIPPTRCG